jgi:hypothetical protein
MDLTTVATPSRGSSRIPFYWGNPMLVSTKPATFPGFGPVPVAGPVPGQDSFTSVLAPMSDSPTWLGLSSSD